MNTEILLRKYTKSLRRPDGTTYFALLLSDAQIIARKTGLPLLHIEIAALESDILPERYCRNQISLTVENQLRLAQSHIAIIGLGGLGGTVTEIMARVGVGKITLVDGDVFDESNLNRQLLSSVSNLGKAKAIEAAKRAREINPAVQAHSVKEFFNLNNGEKILTGVDIAIDCLDTIPDRFILEQACKEISIPFVSAAIGGTSGQATVVYPDDIGLQSIYGSAEKSPTKGAEATLGTLPFAAIYMAAVECAEVTTVLLGKEPTLRNKLFIAEVADHTTEIFHLRTS